MLRERPQVQVDGGEPALAGVEQRFRLRVGKLRAAAVRVNGQLRMVQPQLLCAEPVDPRPQPDDLRGGQKAVAAGDDQVDVGGQAARKHTEKGGHALVCEQVKIVDEQIAGAFPRQLMAEIVRQQPAAGGVRGTGILPQQVDARAGKGVLRAPPEDRKIVGIHADADDAQRLRPLRAPPDTSSPRWSFRSPSGRPRWSARSGRSAAGSPAAARICRWCSASTLALAWCFLRAVM